MNNKYYKVGIYIRLSTEDKDKIHLTDDSESIKNQRHLLLDYINNHPEFILIDEYCDEDLSGAGTYRPAFERLINDCQNGKLDIILCKSQSRFSRDMEIIEKYLHNKFKEWHIRFISLADNADTENIGNKKARQINGLVNEWYLEDVSNNIRSAFLSKMQHGEFISPFASYGYEISKYNNNQLVIDHEAASIVKQIYNLYLKGFGYTGIANYLNNHQIPSPSYYKYQKGLKLNIVSSKPRHEIKWSSNAIKTILTNELYIGNLIQGKRTTISYKNHKIIKKSPQKWIRSLNTHEPIITKEIFNKVQISIKERTKPIKRTNCVHLFSGKVYCLECHHLMRKKSSSSHDYLFCPQSCPNNSSIRYDTLEELILSKINNLLKTYFNSQHLNHFLELTKYKDSINDLLKQKTSIVNSLNNSEKYLKSLYEDKVNHLISLKNFNDLLTIYNNEINIYQHKLSTINHKISSHHKSFNQVITKYQQFNKLNKIIIDEFISQIYIGSINYLTNTRDIKIIWNL